eukprot:gnl/TRDRNA2_/TRDRNA2_147931_c0_seq1.p1 gnl/TRDRNA2_/TRDRNA2_147931_c0~~gnl/TRDRNA2_/TRDRNA2_147931_c0_seq1.p1  ORF type:complete len:285 (+),score=50.28 gnl/TRDRNA2_/TRDRNA2_147931_c0_seq1:18-872(+)
MAETKFDPKECLDYITDVFRHGPFSDQRTWRNVFAGKDKMCPTTSVWGCAVDHMMIRRDEGITAKESKVIPLFEPVGDSQVSSKKVEPLNGQMPFASDHHGLFCVLVDERAEFEKVGVLTMNVWGHMTCPTGWCEPIKKVNLSQLDSTVDVVFFQEIYLQRTEGIKQFEQQLAKVLNGTFRYHHHDDGANVGVAIRDSKRHFLSFAGAKRMRGSHKGVVAVEMASTSNMNRTLLLVGGHLFGGDGHDERYGFKPGVRPEEVKKALAHYEDSCLVWITRVRHGAS